MKFLANSGNHTLSHKGVIMGKIYELFGIVNADIVNKIPCDRLKTSIKSGNYGLGKNALRVNSNNAYYKYLMDEGYRYNVGYWHNMILKGAFCWTDVLGQFQLDVGYVKDGFHPWDYGVLTNTESISCKCYGMMSGLQHFSCDDCHKMCIEFLYKKYMTERRKTLKEIE